MSARATVIRSGGEGEADVSCPECETEITVLVGPAGTTTMPTHCGWCNLELVGDVARWLADEACDAIDSYDGPGDEAYAA